MGLGPYPFIIKVSINFSPKVLVANCLHALGLQSIINPVLLFLLQLLVAILLQKNVSYKYSSYPEIEFLQ